MIPPTGSKLHRLWQCPASLIMAQNTSEDLDARTEPARGRGQEIHKFLEIVRTVGREAALDQVPTDLRDLCEALDIDRMPTHLSTEVAMAWNWKDGTARELGRNLGHRDYDKLGVDWSCEIPCTVDVCGARNVNETTVRGFVGDYKTGRTKYPRPARYGQTLIAALCVRYLLGCEDVVVELIFIDEDGESKPVRDLADAWTLDDFEREVRELMESLPDLERTYHVRGGDALPKREGSHCDHCAAYKACNAKTGLVRAVPEELLKLGARRERNGELTMVWVPKEGKNAKPDEGTWQLDLQPGAITVRNAAAVYEACERVEALCRRMRDEVCGLAFSEPIQLSDGRVIEKYSWKRRSLDGRKAAVVLERHYSREAIMAKLDISLTLDAVKQLAREHVDWNAKPRPVLESKKGTGIVDRLLKEIEEAGGLAWDVGEGCKPHMPRVPKKTG